MSDNNYELLVCSETDIEQKQTCDQRILTRQEFQHLATVPPIIAFIKNIACLQTQRSYLNDIRQFSEFVGIQHPDDYRQVKRAHAIAWRDHLQAEGYLVKAKNGEEPIRKSYSATTIRRKLAALSQLFNFYCNCNSVDFNPIAGITRPKHNRTEGKTPAISDEQMKQLLDAPPTDTLKGIRDRAIIATLGYHGLRRAEVVALLVRQYSRRGGIKHFEVHGKGGKVRYVPVHQGAQALIDSYLHKAGHQEELDEPLFRPITNNSTAAGLRKPLNPNSIYSDVVMRYAREVGITLDTHGFCVHSMRVTAATNAKEHGASRRQVQQWLGHADPRTTELYLVDRQQRAEESPSYKVQY